jgi:hypothetical protein
MEMNAILVVANQVNNLLDAAQLANGEKMAVIKTVEQIAKVDFYHPLPVNYLVQSNDLPNQSPNT